MQFETQVRVPAAPDEVFDYCATVEGFRTQFPFPVRWLEGPASWQGGDVLDFRYRVGGIWMRHRARIVEFERGRCFVDEMTDGLYRSFRHTHRFIADGDRTCVRDQIEFSMGYGNLVDRLIGLPTLGSTFRKRHAALLAHFSRGRSA